VLLPGVTTLARVVARVREEVAGELYATLASLHLGGDLAAWRGQRVVADSGIWPLF